MAKRNNRNLLIIALVAIIAVLIIAVVIKSRNSEDGIKVTAESVEKRTIKEMVAASGKIFPETEVKISSDVSGEIVELYVEEGDSVITGQLLANIDPDAFQSQVERGEASVNSAKAQLANSRAQVENAIAQKEQIIAQLENAQVVYNRNKQLFADGALSEADFQASEANLRGLEANLKAAEASIKSAQQSVQASEFSVKSSEATLRELKTSLRRTSIYAPTNGIISMLSVEQGERVVGTIQMTGTEMMRIANLNIMEVRVDVSENDIPRVSIGDEVDIEVDAYIDRIFKGTVTQIANSASNSATAALTSDQVTNFEVRILINPDSYQDLIDGGNRYPFRPGMSSTVEINTETRSGILTVPIQSVVVREKEDLEGKKGKSDDGDEELDREEELVEVVFIAMEGDTVKAVPVVTGIQDDTYIEVKEGVKEGDKVVSGPYSVLARRLEPGTEINVVKESELYN
ncbi:MAG TPA: efflux RND transporter periplasmic adaptor subunit [Saprospiraceae bacterium]|nr:efflux RND transporter periplasmic adaptor subunit [Saprospiraceae bacterium]